MSLQKSVPKNKSYVFNGLQTKLTGYYPECDRLLSKKCLVKFKFYFKVCKTI